MRKIEITLQTEKEGFVIKDVEVVPKNKLLENLMNLKITGKKNE